MDQNKTSFLEIITASFSAGEVKNFVLAGGYFELIEAPYPVTVRLVDRYGSLRGYMTQAEASFYMRQGEFDAIEITSAHTQTIRFSYGSSEAGTRRTSGVVQVVDSSKSRTLSGAAFLCSSNIAPDVGAASSCVLWNPPGSGFNVFVQGARVSMTSTAQYGAVRISSLGNGLTLRPNARVPKRLGSTPIFEVYETTVSSFNGSDMSFNSVFTAQLAANAIDTSVLKEPLLIEPGEGLRIFVAATNIGLVSTMELIQEAI